MKKSDHKLYNRARNSFYDQRKRCYNPKNPMYKWYGKKGVRVDYSLDEFLLWYYEAAKSFKRPTVDRIDHAKDYSFENIQIVEKSENSKERISRLGTPIPRKTVLAYRDGLLVGEYDSAYHAKRDLDPTMNPSNIRSVCIGQRLSHHGFTFKYKE